MTRSRVAGSAAIVTTTSGSIASRAADRRLSRQEGSETVWKSTQGPTTTRPSEAISSAGWAATTASEPSAWTAASAVDQVTTPAMVTASAVAAGVRSRRRQASTPVQAATTAAHANTSAHCVALIPGSSLHRARPITRLVNRASTRRTRGWRSPPPAG
jgi:hypothetical protein